MPCRAKPCQLDSNAALSSTTPKITQIHVTPENQAGKRQGERSGLSSGAQAGAGIAGGQPLSPGRGGWAQRAASLSLAPCQTQSGCFGTAIQ